VGALALSFERCAAALSRVGLTIDDIQKCGGSVLNVGAPYLVGSLAQGFGNRGSDVDLHLLVDDTPLSSAPFLLFVNGVTVDIEQHPISAPNRITSTLSTAEVMLPLGRIALEPTAYANDVRLTRWSTALPLHDKLPPIIEPSRVGLVMAHLARRALSATFIAWAAAHLAERAGSDATYLWRLCGWAILDLVCAGSGYPPVDRKWLPARVSQARIPKSIVDGVLAVTGTDHVREQLTTVGLPGVDAVALARIERAPGLQGVTIGTGHFLLTPRGQLEQTSPAEGPVSGFRDEMGARYAMDCVRVGLSCIALDEVAVSDALRAIGDAM